MVSESVETENQRERVTSQDELRAYLGSLTDAPADRTLKLLLLLGQRRDEVGRTDVCEIREDLRNIPGGMTGRTKNKLPHVVPLTQFAKELLSSGFNLYPTTLLHRFRDIVRAHEMPDIRLHDLRHCRTTGMAAIGIPREVRERVQNQRPSRRPSYGCEHLNEKQRASLTLPTQPRCRLGQTHRRDIVHAAIEAVESRQPPAPRSERCSSTIGRHANPELSPNLGDGGAGQAAAGSG